jgi:hypothetical protein
VFSRSQAEKMPFIYRMCPSDMLILDERPQMWWVALAVFRNCVLGSFREASGYYYKYNVAISVGT